jgi:hypothetical protein
MELQCNYIKNEGKEKEAAPVSTASPEDLVRWGSFDLNLT